MVIDAEAHALILALARRVVQAPTGEAPGPAVSVLFSEGSPMAPPFEIQHGFTISYAEDRVLGDLGPRSQNIPSEDTTVNIPGFYRHRGDIENIEFALRRIAWGCVALGEFSDGGEEALKALHAIMKDHQHSVVPEWVGDKTRRKLLLLARFYTEGEIAVGSPLLVAKEANSLFELAEQALEKIAKRTGRELLKYDGPFPPWRNRRNTSGIQYNVLPDE